MTKAVRPRQHVVVSQSAVYIAVLILWGLLAATAQAQVSGDDDFSLRLPAALSRLSVHMDVAATGGASAGSKWPSSVNPASIGWLDLPVEINVALVPEYMLIRFGDGNRAHITAEVLTLDLGKWGRIQPLISQARASNVDTRQGLEFQFDLDKYQLLWGKQIADDWAVGGGFNFSHSSTGFDLGTMKFSRTRSDGYGARLGVLHRIVDPLMVGAVASYSFTNERTTMFGIPPGFGIPDIVVRQTTHELFFQPGISYEYLEGSAIYCDYQFGSFWNDTGSISVHRFLTGVSHQLLKGLFLRAGITLDVGGHTTLTGGLGFSPCENLLFEVAYQENALPEIQEEFGKAGALGFSVVLVF